MLAIFSQQILNSMKVWLWGHFIVIVLSLFLWELSGIITLDKANALQVNSNYNQAFYLWCQICNVFEIFQYETGWWILIKYSSLSVGTNVPFKTFVFLTFGYTRDLEFLLLFSYFPECLASLDITGQPCPLIRALNPASPRRGRAPGPSLWNSSVHRAHTQFTLSMSQPWSKVKTQFPWRLVDYIYMPPPTHLFHLPTMARKTNA